MLSVHGWLRDAAQQICPPRTYLPRNRRDRNGRARRPPLPGTGRKQIAMTDRPIHSAPETQTATLDVAAIRAAAVAARDAAIGDMLRRAARAVAGGIRWFLEMLDAWRESREAYQRLRTMSDRELADIGLDRGQIARVFDPAFRIRAGAEAPAAANDSAPAESRAA